MVIAIIIFIIYGVYTTICIKKIVDFFSFLFFVCNDLFLFPLLVLFIHIFEIFSYYPADTLTII